MKISRLSAILVASLLLISVGTSPLMATPSDHFSNFRTIRDIDPQLPSEELVKIQLDTRGERAPIESWPAGHVLNVAAEYYSLLTGDKSVSVKEVVDYGLWPYYMFPRNVNMDQTIHSGEFHAFVITRWMGNERNMLLEAKHQILRQVQLRFQKGLPGSPELTIEHNNLNRIPAFWTNPITSEPMRESTAAGDYSVTERTSLEGQETTAWLTVNRFDTSKYASVSSSDLNNLETDMCCYLFWDQETVPAEEEKCITFQCPCGEEIWNCKVCWAFSCTTYINQYQYVLAPCDDEPSGFWLKFDCPPAAPSVRSTVYKDNCTLLYVNATGKCAACTFILDQPCFDAIADFMDDLDDPGHSVDIPGGNHLATCNCAQ